MNYKELFQRLFTLLASPKKAWVEISSESPRRDVMGGFVYPLIALCGLVVLLSAFVHDGFKREVYQPALMSMCSYCIALFGGFFLSSYLTELTRQKYLAHQADQPGSQLFVGYSMGVIFVAEILIIIFPQLYIFQWIFRFYVLYVVWEGSSVLFNVEENKRLMFTALTSASIIASPIIIRYLFTTLSDKF